MAKFRILWKKIENQNQQNFVSKVKKKKKNKKTLNP